MQARIITSPRYGKTRLVNFINAINCCESEEELKIIKELYGTENDAAKVQGMMSIKMEYNNE